MVAEKATDTTKLADYETDKILTCQQAQGIQGQRKGLGAALYVLTLSMSASL